MFALLEHTTGTDRHWDLLIEAPGAERLATWRLAANPLETVGAVPAERLQDHRRVYLEFEGELTGGRGIVRRLDRGGAVVRTMKEDEAAFALAGEQLRGDFEIARTVSGLAFRRSESPSPSS
ncbi:MAG: DNA polymerase ligase N-terminal domain-containing protein [Planctomycetota bacterium]